MVEVATTTPKIGVIIKNKQEVNSIKEQQTRQRR